MIRLSPPIAGSAQFQLERCKEMLDAYIEKTRGDRKPRLKALRPAIVVRWEAYFASRGDPSKFGQSTFPRSKPKTDPPSDGELLYDCYSSGTRADKDIVALASAVRRSMCPYCGLRLRLKPKGRAYDRDHMTPRSSHPEFSVLVMNLVDSCGDCNVAKGTDIVDKQGRWILIHPYFDDFLGHRLIVAKVQLAAGGEPPVLLFLPSVGALPVPDQQRVLRHVQHLDVLARIEEEALHELRLLLDMQRLHGAAPIEIRSVFAALARERLAAHPNDPVAIALEAVAASEHFPQFLS